MWGPQLSPTFCPLPHFYLWSRTSFVSFSLFQQFLDILFHPGFRCGILRGGAEYFRVVKRGNGDRNGFLNAGHSIGADDEFVHLGLDIASIYKRKSRYVSFYVSPYFDFYPNSSSTHSTSRSISDNFFPSKIGCSRNS